MIFTTAWYFLFQQHAIIYLCATFTWHDYLRLLFLIGTIRLRTYKYIFATRIISGWTVSHFESVILEMFTLSFYVVTGRLLTHHINIFDFLFHIQLWHMKSKWFKCDILNAFVLIIKLWKTHLNILGRVCQENLYPTSVEWSEVAFPFYGKIFQLQMHYFEVYNHKLLL